MKILVIDDEPQILEFLGKYLRREGHAVELGEDGEQGLSHFFLHPESFDAIITDVRMPDLNGVEMVEKIRKKGFETPVIFITGHLGEKENIITSKLKFVDLLLKPFTFDKLSSILEKI